MKTTSDATGERYVQAINRGLLFLQILVDFLVLLAHTVVRRQGSHNRLSLLRREFVFHGHGSFLDTHQPDGIRRVLPFRDIQ